MCTERGAHVHLVGWAVGPRGARSYYCVKAVLLPRPAAAETAVLLVTVGEVVMVVVAVVAVAVAVAEAAMLIVSIVRSTAS